MGWASAGGTDIRAVSRLIFAAYFLQAGLILIVAPWSPVWDANGFLTSVPSLSSWLVNPAIRGAVSGIGLITASAGLVELASLMGWGRGTGAPPDGTAPQ